MSFFEDFLSSLAFLLSCRNYIKIANEFPSFPIEESFRDFVSHKRHSEEFVALLSFREAYLCYPEERFFCHSERSKSGVRNLLIFNAFRDSLSLLRMLGMTVTNWSTLFFINSQFIWHKACFFLVLIVNKKRFKKFFKGGRDL